MVAGSFLLLGLFVACEHTSPMSQQQQQQQQPPAGLQAMLSSIQTNIFTPKCVNAGCHPGGGAPMPLRNANESFQNLVGVPTGRPRVVRGDASTSILYLKIIGTSAGTRMPQGLAPLSQAEQDSIKTWINRGAQNN
jgi:hypothetical protein